MVNCAICWKLSLGERYESISNKRCSKCRVAKLLSQFDKNGEYYYSICKDCKRVRGAARRYNCSIQTIITLYSITHCECCGDKFKDNYHQHIHHLQSTIRGVVCRICNRILGNESEDVVERIKCCLEFMKSDRENLFNRDNQQGSALHRKHHPSTTTRAARKLRRAMQAQCYTFRLTLGEVTELRNNTQCACCYKTFTAKNFPAIHHVDNKVLGYICNACNNLLGQETESRVSKLIYCLRWIEIR